MKAESKIIRVCFLVALLCLGCTSGERTHNDEAANLTLSSQQQSLQSPRNTNDILAAIRSVKANQENVQPLTAIADAPAPSGDQLWNFYRRRALAAEQIGRPEQALEEAVRKSKTSGVACG